MRYPVRCKTRPCGRICSLRYDGKAADQPDGCCSILAGSGRCFPGWRVVIDTRDDRYADDNLTASCRQRSQICQDCFVGHAGELAVPRAVHQFKVVKKQIDIRCDLCQVFPGGITVVSTVVCSPMALQARSASARNSGWSSGSPPEKVTPPPDSS